MNKYNRFLFAFIVALPVSIVVIFNSRDQHYVICGYKKHTSHQPIHVQTWIFPEMHSNYKNLSWQQLIKPHCTFFHNLILKVNVKMLYFITVHQIKAQLTGFQLVQYKNYLCGLTGNRDMSIVLNENDNHCNKNLKFKNSLWIQEGKISHMSFQFQL